MKNLKGGFVSGQHLVVCVFHLIDHPLNIEFFTINDALGCLLEEKCHELDILSRNNIQHISGNRSNKKTR